MKVDRAKFALQQLDGEEGFLRFCTLMTTVVGSDKDGEREAALAEAAARSFSMQLAAFGFGRSRRQLQ